ncbi:MAG: D-alanine--D-alanine ligase [Actinobacteria bacterium]|nr:MAG: D-alanine--D-alanine ligase [Actinomycetota bacterium]
MSKIAVLMGGRSLERDVSLKSGHRVSDALEKKGHKVARLDVDKKLVGRLKKERPDLVYIALHGKFGEDGTVQELLEILGIPYTGPGVYSSILGFDKVLSKETFLAEGIPTADFYVLSTAAIQEMGASDALPGIIKKIGLPVVVKPARQGSALGIKIAHKEAELKKAIIGALNYDHKIIIEKFIKGTEISVSILGNKKLKALPVVEIVPKKEFFDFASMYTMGKTDYYIPARLDAKLTKKVQDIALKVHKILQCRDVSRVDMIVDRKKNPQVLEINTSPGMTETSLLPMAAEAAGMSFEDLVDRIVKLALNR